MSTDREHDDPKRVRLVLSARASVGRPPGRAKSSSPALVRPHREWADLLQAATLEVFEIVLGKGLQSTAEPAPSSNVDLTAMIGLAGRLSGVLSVRCSTATALGIASRMWGKEIVAFDGDVRDALGEICNMVAGGFKARVAGLADGCLISVPTVITGRDYQLHSLADAACIQTCLLYDGGPLWVILDLHS